MNSHETVGHVQIYVVSDLTTSESLVWRNYPAFVDVSASTEFNANNAGLSARLDARNSWRAAYAGHQLNDHVQVISLRFFILIYSPLLSRLK